jgi:hypothetical protein
MLALNWVKLTTGAWCPFETVNLSNVSTMGVYIIWHAGNPGRVVRVGQGDISYRLTAHRKDKTVLAYGSYGLLVTWAYVPANQRDGVERYLAETWSPLVGDRFPYVPAIAVNSPWG